MAKIVLHKYGEVVRLVLVAFIVLALQAPRAAAAETPVDALQQLGEDIIQAGKLASTNQNAEAWELLRPWVGSMAMAALDEEMRCKTERFAGALAYFQSEPLTAVELLQRTASCPDASADDWQLLLFSANRAERSEVAAAAVKAIAIRFPRELKSVPKQQIYEVARQLAKDPKMRDVQLETLTTLFAARWTDELDEEPASLWQRLALAHLDAGQTRAANEVAARIDDTDVLASMLADKRCAPLIRENPRRFNLTRALDEELARKRRLAARHPRSLRALMSLTYALYAAGRFTEELALVDAALGKLEQRGDRAFEDAAEHVVWLHDQRARALKALGRFDEARDVWEGARKMDESGSRNVSQSINLGYLYVSLNRPTEALRVISEMDWLKDTSEYGRTQLLAVRHRALLQLGRKDEAADAFRYLERNRADSRETYLSALLAEERIDDAAAFFVEWLGQPDEATDALAVAQKRLLAAQTDIETANRARFEEMFARPEVEQAIAAVGVRLEVPLF